MFQRCTGGEPSLHSRSLRKLRFFGALNREFLSDSTSAFTLKYAVALFDSRPILTTVRPWQTTRADDQSSNTSKEMKMPGSTSSLRFDPKPATPPTDVNDARKPLRAEDAGHAEDVQINRSNDHPGSWKRPGEGPPLEELLRWLARSLAVMAVLSSVALLCVGATPLLSWMPAYIAAAAFGGWALLRNLPLPAIPLLLAGSSYLMLQAILRPPP